MPLALALATPLRTRARIIESSNSENTAINCKNATVIGSGSVVRQSMVILPKIWSLMHLDLITSTIWQNCCTERDRRDGSVMITVSPGLTVSHIMSCCSLTSASPCSYSLHILVAPAARNSRTWRSMSWRVSLVEHRA